VIGMSVQVMRIATGEETEETADPTKEHHRRGGLKGGAQRALALSPEQRIDIAKRAAARRWKKN
jgi:hypothetical protein